MTDDPKKLPEIWRGTAFVEVLKATRNYIVFINKNMRPEWKTAEGFLPPLAGGGESILAEALGLSRMPQAGFGPQRKLQSSRLTGKIAVCYFEGSGKRAEAALEAARHYMEQMKEVSTRGYLCARVIWAALLTGIATAIWQERHPLIRDFGNAAFWLTLATIAGSLGALFSLIARSGKVRFDPASARSSHYSNALAYILMGALCGLAVVVDNRIERILTHIPRELKPLGALALAMLAAAVLERLASWFTQPRKDV